ncbi:MAG: GNAT family N-acetyltransferase [Limnothrix sp.]
MPEGFSTKRGHATDRALLLKFLHRSYREFYPAAGFGHLQNTLNNYLTADTPLWWVRNSANIAVGCLWMGITIDQISGDRHSHIFLLYVLSDYRRQGIGSELMNTAEAHAKSLGDRQISLQVFTANQNAQNFYQKLDYASHSIMMQKSLE